MTNQIQAAKAVSSDSTGVRYTREDALSDLEFELLLDSAYELKRFEDLETRFILLVGGRLGLRRGELAHMREEWVNWRKRRIDIPTHQLCDKGRSGGPCGHCRQMAQQSVDHNEGLTFDEAIEDRWEPKTRMAARSIPYSFSGRTEIVLERYFEEFDQWMYTGQAINRRLNKVAEMAPGFDRNLYPHALRATAASYHAGRGLDTLALQAMMGWAQPSTARNYIAQSADNLDRKLHFINNG